MIYFIEVTDSNGSKRMINTSFITDIFENIIYLNCGCSGEQQSIKCIENYEQIKKLIRGFIYRGASDERSETF